MSDSSKIEQMIVPYLVVMPYHNVSNATNNKDLRFSFLLPELVMGSDPSCSIQLAGLEPKHARVYYSAGKWYIRDLTRSLQIRQQGLLSRWFPLEFDSQTFVVGPWLCCFFTGRTSEASTYDQNLKTAGETDALTALPLRPPFDRRLKYEIEHCCKKNRQPVSVLHLDLDHFHDLNERYDHVGGDAVLREVAERLRAQTRGREMVARYGGEELVVLLPYTPEKQAMEVAERLRRAIADLPISFGNENIPITASIGCSTTHYPIEPEVLVAQADRAMYRAKSMGRNCVCLYDPSVDGVLTAGMLSQSKQEREKSSASPLETLVREGRFEPNDQDD